MVKFEPDPNPENREPEKDEQETTEGLFIYIIEYIGKDSVGGGSEDECK